MKFTKLSDKDLYALCKEYGRKARFWRRKFAGLLPEVERRCLYRRRRCGSIYEFAAKLAGMSKESVDKVLRLSKKLEDKPFLLEQLETGAQSWSKLEKVAYIATSQTDGAWAERIENMPQPAVEAFVQNFRLKTTLQSETEPVKSAIQFTVKLVLAQKLQQLSKRADFESLLEKFEIGRASCRERA